MKKHQLFILLITINWSLLTVSGQTGTWIWGRQATGPALEEGWAVATDANGNIYGGGEYYNTVVFDTVTMPNANLSGTSSDAFVVKYNSNGAVIWARHAGGNNGDAVKGIATDASGNVYVTGYFTSASITFGTYTLTLSGAGDMFLVKYSPSGTVLWAKNAVSSSNDQGNAVATDAQGNVFVTGSFHASTITFGTNTLNNIHTYGEDMFIVKYDSSGTAQWAKNAGGGGPTYGYSVAADPSGNVFVTGSYWDSALVIGTNTFANAGWADLFIAKYSSTGTLLWAQHTGGNDGDEGFGIATDAYGNAFLSGYSTSNTTTFGTYTWNGIGNYLAFIVKYDPAGTVIAANHHIGGRGYAVATVPASAFVPDGVYMSGDLHGGSMYVDTIHLTPLQPSCDALFIVKYDASLNVVCANVLSSGGDDNNAVAADTYGNAYVAGDFGCGPFHVGHDTLMMTQTSGEFFFVARYNCDVFNNGINESTGDETISLYPNPTDGKFTIDCSLVHSLIGSIVNVTNVLGEIIYQFKIASPKSEINLSGISKGIYFVKITDENKNTINKKIIIN